MAQDQGYAQVAASRPPAINRSLQNGVFRNTMKSWRSDTSFFLVLLSILFASVLCPPHLVAHQDNIYSLGGMHIGDELKAFNKRFPQSRCHPRHSVALEKAELRRGWLEWVDCGADSNVLSSDDVLSGRVSGGNAQMYATFFQKRLVSVEYLLVDIPYDPVLRAYIEKYGVPQRAANGFGISAWSRPCCQLTMEEVSLFTTVDSLGRLCIGKVPRAKAVRLWLTSRVSGESESSKDTETLSLDAPEH